MIYEKKLDQLRKTSNMHTEHVLMRKHGKHIVLKYICTVAVEQHYEVNAILIAESKMRRLIFKKEQHLHPIKSYGLLL